MPYSLVSRLALLTLLALLSASCGPTPRASAPAAVDRVILPGAIADDAWLCLEASGLATPAEFRPRCVRVGDVRRWVRDQRSAED